MWAAKRDFLAPLSAVASSELGSLKKSCGLQASELVTKLQERVDTKSTTSLQSLGSYDRFCG